MRRKNKKQEESIRLLSDALIHANGEVSRLLLLDLERTAYIRELLGKLAKYENAN